MFHKMKMFSLKNKGFTLMFLAIIGLIGIILYGRNAYNFYTMPVKINENNIENDVNKYVEFDFDDVMIINCFMEKRQERLFGETVVYYYYLIGIEDSKENINFLVCVSDKEEKELFDKGIKNFNKNQKGKKINAKKSGMLLKMDSFLEKRFHQCLASTGLINSNKTNYISYYISDYTPKLSDVIIFLIAALILCYAIIDLIFIMLGGKQHKIYKKIKKELGKDAKKTVERDYELSRFFNPNIRVGDIYVYMFGTDCSTIINLKDIVWVYECTRDDVDSKGKKISRFSGIEIWDTDYELYEIYTKDKIFINGFLDYIISKCAHTVVGYNMELEKVFLHDSEAFRKIVFNKNR